nr:transcriptional repressor [Blautia sp. MSJ-9]
MILLYHGSHYQTSVLFIFCNSSPTCRGRRILAIYYVKKYLKEMGIKVNTTTVYRYLDKLCAEHVVIKYPDLNSDKAVFQFAGEEKKCTDHLHLKCIRCGNVVHLDCDFMGELKEHLFRDHGFRLQCSGDMLHGICKDCENKSDQL